MMNGIQLKLTFIQEVGKTNEFNEVKRIKDMNVLLILLFMGVILSYSRGIPCVRTWFLY